jgi:hypothetical protein
MRLIRKSAVTEYAQHFWRRERGKMDPNAKLTFQALDAGEDPVTLLKECHRYKLPRQHNICFSVVAITSREEVDGLLFHAYALRDEWTKERGLVPEPFTQRLGELAAMCLDRGYFTSSRNDRQIRHFNQWKERGTLAGVIDANEMPLIEALDTCKYEIVDGWGRLLPFSALLAQGMPFEPFQVFLATSHDFQ